MKWIFVIWIVVMAGVTVKVSSQILEKNKPDGHSYILFSNDGPLGGLVHDMQSVPANWHETDLGYWLAFCGAVGSGLWLIGILTLVKPPHDPWKGWK